MRTEKRKYGNEMRREQGQGKFIFTTRDGYGLTYILVCSVNTHLLALGFPKACGHATAFLYQIIHFNRWYSRATHAFYTQLI